MNRMVSFAILMAILVVIVVLFFRVMAGFLVPMFLAVLLVIMFRPLHERIKVRCQERDRLAAGLTTLAILAIVLLPMFGILIQAASEASSLIANWDSEAVKERFAALRVRVGLKLLPQPIEDKLNVLHDLFTDFAADAQDDLLVKELPGIKESLEEVRQQLETLEPGAATASGAKQKKKAADWKASYDRLQSILDALEETPPDSDEFASLKTKALLAFDEFRLAAVGHERSQPDRRGFKGWLNRQANPDPEHVAALRDRVLGFLGPMALATPQVVGGFLGELLLGLGVMIVSLYYFLADGPTMIRAFMRLSPLDDKYEEQLFHEFVQVSRAVVVATLASAVAQGFIAGVGYFFAGFPSVFLLMMLTMLFALIPFVGAAAVWVPCSIWLLVDGRTTAAIMLALYGGLVISMADNVIKPFVLKGQSNLHPLLALLSVLGGVQVMGPIGILIGPMLVTFLQSLLKMIQAELDALAKPEK